VDPKTQSYSFGSLQIEELSPITLTFDVPQFDVTVTQNGWGGAYVKRNQGLTNLPTNPAFIYQTPLVRFNDTVVPFIVNQEIIPLNGDFQTAIGSFFAQLLLNQQQPAPLTNSYAFKLTLYYSHTLLPSPGPGLDPIVTMVPVVFEPQMQLTPAYGITQFAADLWSQADTWIGLNNPILAVGDSWSLEITMFSSLTGQTTMPVLEMTRLTNTITGG
jgi:hypothetical protein